MAGTLSSASAMEVGDGEIPALIDEAQVDRSRMDTELALTYKLRQLFPHLPDEVMMRVVPLHVAIRHEGLRKRRYNRSFRRRLRYVTWFEVPLLGGVPGILVPFGVNRTSRFPKSKVRAALLRA